MIVKCPTCGKSVEWNIRSDFRPFCSKRCQIIDLGDWAEGQNSIPGKPAMDPNLMSDEELENFIHSLEE